MGLFGKKKEEDVKPEELGFGFPASEKRREVEGVTPMERPPVPKAPAQAEAPPQPPKLRPQEPTPQAPAPPAPQQPRAQQAQAPAPQPIQVQPVKPAAPTQKRPALEARPMVPATMPEDVQAPRAPRIKKLRPHVFLKISKYKEVMSNIDKVMNHIKDLKKSLENIKDVEEKESIKIKESEEVLTKLEQVAKTFDKIFSSPEK